MQTSTLWDAFCFISCFGSVCYCFLYQNQRKNVAWYLWITIIKSVDVFRKISFCKDYIAVQYLLIRKFNEFETTTQNFVSCSLLLITKYFLFVFVKSVDLRLHLQQKYFVLLNNNKCIIVRSMLLFKGAKQIGTLLHMCNVLDSKQFLRIKFVHITR